jgi:uncharacterized membrane protein
MKNNLYALSPEAVPFPNITYREKVIDKSYSFTSIMIMFFGFSFVGWLWEVALGFFRTGILVNRGTMHGIWLPIYGVGGVLIVVLLRKYQNKHLQCFVKSMAICAIVEYLSSLLLEKLFNARWWDYSNEFMNLDGRICLFGLLIFGVAGCGAVCKVAPLIDRKIMSYSQKSRIIVCVVLGIIFAVDFMFSIVTPNVGAGISSVISN